MKAITNQFGIHPERGVITEYTLDNGNGIEIKVLDYGCTISSLKTPDRKGHLSDIVTGYRTYQEWIDNPAYFGCIVGRVCNRIGNARFYLEGNEYKVSANHGKHHLHGGFHGFNKKIWKGNPVDTNNAIGIQFETFSQDGEEGYPGLLLIKARYLLTKNNEFIMELNATTDKPTPVNMTNHTYFNLGGEDSGDIYKHELQINADLLTETDDDSIPTGQFISVHDSAFDFRSSHSVGERIHELPYGYDNNFVLRQFNGELNIAAIIFDPLNGRKLEISTTEPGIQLYTSNWFDGSLIGKSGKPYLKHCAFALETQHYPDSVNHDNFPGVILHPGESFASVTKWKFTTI